MRRLHGAIRPCRQNKVDKKRVGEGWGDGSQRHEELSSDPMYTHGQSRVWQCAAVTLAWEGKRQVRYLEVTGQPA